MVVFDQYGYSPNNFVALVEHSGLSQDQFMADNNITKSTYYRYKTGETSMCWRRWKALVAKYNLEVAINKKHKMR